MVNNIIIANMVKYDPKFAAFEGEVSTEKNTYSILLPEFEETEQQEADTLALHIANWLDQQLESVKQYAAQQLVPLKNKTWLEKGESPVTETQFIATINLEGITAYPDGDFEVFFHDNDIFFGHDICVKISKDFIFQEASI